MALAIASLIAPACQSNNGWTAEERKALREMIKSYRNYEYINSLSDNEYIVFSDNVGVALEEAYPVYTTFIAIPNVNGTVEEWVITEVASQIQADPTNLRHLFPYNELTTQKILPAGLDRDSRKAFYSCLASKTNANFPSLNAFLMGIIINDSATNAKVKRFESECAAELFEWVVSEDVEVITEI